MRVNIIGAGPAGLLLANYLLDRKGADYTVSIFERRPDPRTVQNPDEQRTYPISLQKRGLNALDRIAGLEKAVQEQGVLCHQSVRHSGTKSRSIKRRDPLLLIDRNKLSLTLLESLVQRHGSEKCQIRFNTTFQEIDVTTKSFTCTDGSSYTYDALVAADGARSAVRESLQKQGLVDCKLEPLPSVYKTIFLSRKSGDLELAADGIHGTMVAPRTPENGRVVLAPVGGKDRLHGAFVVDTRYTTKDDPFALFQTKEMVLDYFKTYMPTFGALLSEKDAGEFANRPVARTWTVECDRLHCGDCILLIGDAAHAVSPSAGQGCNSALQDVMIFNEILDECHDDWSRAVTEFTKRRLEDVHALKELSDYAQPPTKRLILEFFARTLWRRLLHRLSFRRFHRFYIDEIMETDISYADILRHHKGWFDKVKRASQNDL